MAVATTRDEGNTARAGRSGRRPGQRLGIAAPQGADDRRRGQDPEPGVRRHLDLQDPLPGGPEAALAAAHPGRLPALQPDRRRAPAGDPAHAARRVPALAGDPPGAGHRRLHRLAARERGRGDHGGRRPWTAPVSMLSAGGAARPGRRAPRGCCASSRSSASSSPIAATGGSVYDETDLEIVRAAAELSRFGVAGRNLRVFVSSADREAALLQQLVGPALRSRSQARRKEAIENLESLAAVCGHLKHLLLVRDLRRLKGDVGRCRGSRRARGLIAAPRERVWDAGLRSSSPAALVAADGAGGGRAPGSGWAPQPLDDRARYGARHRRAGRLPVHQRHRRRALRVGAGHRGDAV